MQIHTHAYCMQSHMHAHLPPADTEYNYISLSVCLSVSVCLCLSLCLCLCLSVCLSVSLSLSFSFSLTLFSPSLHLPSSPPPPTPFTSSPSLSSCCMHPLRDTPVGQESRSRSTIMLTECLYLTSGWLRCSRNRREEEDSAPHLQPQHGSSADWSHHPFHQRGKRYHRQRSWREHGDSP